MVRKFFLKIISLYLLIANLFKRRIFNFEDLVKKKKKTSLIFTRSEALYMVKSMSYFSKLLNINSCFTKCLTYKSAYELANCNYKLHVGVRNGPDGFKSHCWIESGGLFNEASQNINEFKVLRTFE